MGHEVSSSAGAPAGGRQRVTAAHGTPEPPVPHGGFEETIAALKALEADERRRLSSYFLWESEESGRGEAGRGMLRALSDACDALDHVLSADDTIAGITEIGRLLNRASLEQELALAVATDAWLQDGSPSHLLVIASMLADAA